MPDAETLNRGKITKAVYVLLQGYHRTHGLRAQPWCKPPGNAYFSFYSDAVRDADDRPLHLPGFEGRYALTVYQDQVGSPEWSDGGRQLEHPRWKEHELRTEELVRWYEGHLSLDALFRDHEDAIRTWRRAYHVGESERYLLTWNVLGLYASGRGATCCGWGCSEYWNRSQGEAMLAALPTARPRESLICCEGLVFCTDGRVLLPDGEVVDIWERRLAGDDAATLADGLVATEARP